MPIGPAQANNADFGRGSAVAPTAAVPFQRRVDPQSLSTLLTLQQSEQRRLQRYSEHWNFYYGRHWNFAREDGEPLVTLNYFRKLLDKSVSFLVGKGVTYTVPEAVELVTLPFIEKVWKDNNEQGLLFEIGIMGAVSGDVFILFTYEEPTAIEKRVNPFSKGKVRINLLGSEQVFPTWDPLDITKMTEVRIETLVADPYLQRDAVLRGEGSPPVQDNTAARSVPGMLRFTQIITADKIIRMRGDAPAEISPNILGEIPLVHIKNLSLPNEYYGLPDGQDLIDLNRELNEKATDISDVVNYHSSPITVITGAKAKQLDRGPKKIWSGLPEGAKVFNLVYEGDMQASQTYMDRVKKTMHELSDVPENALGGEQAISNTSGVALSMLYRPLIEKTEKKQATYGPGLEKGNYFILRLAQATGQLTLPFDLCESCGGRIVEHAVTIPGSDDGYGRSIVRKRKSCFEIDRQSLDFLDPMEMKMKFLQKYEEGHKVREDEFWKILNKYRKLTKSFWQPDKKPEPQELATPEEKQSHDAVVAEATGVPAPPKSAEVKTEEEQKYAERNSQVGKATGGENLDIPAEPEEVEIIAKQISPEGVVTDLPRIKRQLVPTGCKVNEYLNPFKTECNFADPLPRDEKMAADLYMQYLAMKIVSVKWVQRQIPALANDLTLINKEIEESPPPEVAQPGDVKAPELKTPEDIQKEIANGPAQKKYESKGVNKRLAE